MFLHVKARIQFLLAICLLLSYDKANARHSLSEQESLKLEKQLQLLNKPAIKTIKINNGDIYDCVDFYKQPAFDHPLLKNHDFSPQMKPSLHKLERHAIASKKVGLKGGGCPFGTVPIRRVTKDDLIRQRYMHGMDETPAFQGNNLNDSESVAFQGGYRYAGVQLPDDQTNDITGAGMFMSLNKPLAQKNQHSAGRVKVQNGPDRIQVGWIAGKSGCDSMCNSLLFASFSGYGVLSISITTLVLIVSTIAFTFSKQRNSIQKESIQEEEETALNSQLEEQTSQVNHIVSDQQHQNGNFGQPGLVMCKPGVLMTTSTIHSDRKEKDTRHRNAFILSSRNQKE